MERRVVPDVATAMAGWVERVFGLPRGTAAPVTLWKRTLVVFKDAYYIVSEADVAGSGPETLVFPATPRGAITSWVEVCGGKGQTFDDALDALVALSDDPGRRA